MLWRISCNTPSTSANRRADKGVSPGVLRASARTKERARLTTYDAMHDHNDPHTIWEYGCMVRDRISANEAGRICSAFPRAVSVKPELHVPRKPRVSHPERGSAV